MSFQNIPDMNTSVDFSREDSANLLLASIAFEEFGLARLIDAEAEKVQYVLGTLKDRPPMCPPATLDQILTVNRTVDQMLRDIIKKEILLQLKLESVLDAKKLPKPTPQPCPPHDGKEECKVYANKGCHSDD